MIDLYINFTRKIYNCPAYRFYRPINTLIAQLDKMYLK